MRGESGVEPEPLMLAQVEPARPLTELDRPGRAALGTYYPGGPAARAVAEGVLLHQDDLLKTGLAEEIGAPGAYRSAADHDRVGGLGQTSGHHWHKADADID